MHYAQQSQISLPEGDSRLAQCLRFGTRQHEQRLRPQGTADPAQAVSPCTSPAVPSGRTRRSMLPLTPHPNALPMTREGNNSAPARTLDGKSIRNRAISLSPHGERVRVRGGARVRDGKAAVAVKRGLLTI